MNLSLRSTAPLALLWVALAPARALAQCPNPDAYEDNDFCPTLPGGLATDWAAITELVAGHHASLTGESSESDFYRISVPTGTVLVVDVLFADAGGDIIAQILNGCHLNTHALDHSDTPDDNEHLTWTNDTDLAVDVVLEVAAYEPPLGPFCNDYELVIAGGAGAVGSIYCVSSPSSANAGATASAVGSASVSANSLVLLASPLPTGQPGLFFYGPETAQTPFGDGTLCVAPGALGLIRLPIVNASPFGVLTTPVDFTQPPTSAGQITPGSTWRFQAWFRDPAAGGSGFNLSTGLSIDFAP